MSFGFYGWLNRWLLVSSVVLVVARVLVSYIIAILWLELCWGVLSFKDIDMQWLGC